MNRFLPKSLLGQVTLVLALGLLVAQTVSVIALYRANEQRRDATLVNSIALRLIAETAGRESAAARSLRAQNNRSRRPPSRDRQQRQLERMADSGLAFPRADGSAPPLADVRRGGGLPFSRLMRLSLQRSADAPVEASAKRLLRYETELARVLKEQDLAANDIRIVRRKAGDDTYVRQIISEVAVPPFRNWAERRLLVAAIRQEGTSEWLTVRLPEPKREGAGLPLIIFQTLVIFTVLMIPLFLVLRRLTQPLAQLTERVDDFSRKPDQAVRLEERGPADTRRLIAAHNAMEARIAALLDEKDVMLGAIGHDLKTPLAALRVRIESVPDDIQRERMAATIEDITATLDDILSLARVGRSGSPPEMAELGALATSVTEEFEDLGEPVSIADAPRVVCNVQVTWLKRALRNLIVNAVRYGGQARVSVFEKDGQAILRVDDAGPGIPTDKIADMLEPFARGEVSRNRATGGAGLGLTLARAIVVAHGGHLKLTNRTDGGNQTGLRAELHLPL